MLALATRLKADAAGFALRFLGGFVLAAALWGLLAPAYAGALARAGALVAPAFDPGSRYESEGAKVSALRPLGTMPDGRVREARQGIWSAAVSWGTPLFVAAVVATPGWPWPRRWRALALGCGVLALGHFANLLVNAALTRGRLPGAAAGGMGLLLEWLSGFFDLVLMPALPVGLYLVLATAESSAGSSAGGGAAPRNAPCPCGSGVKYKRCCGAASR